MVVYLVWYKRNMVGVYSTVEKAKALIQRMDSAEFEEDGWDIVDWEVDL